MALILFIWLFSCRSKEHGTSNIYRDGPNRSERDGFRRKSLRGSVRTAAALLYVSEEDTAPKEITFSSRIWESYLTVRMWCVFYARRRRRSWRETDGGYGSRKCPNLKHLKDSGIYIRLLTSFSFVCFVCLFSFILLQTLLDVRPARTRTSDPVLKLLLISFSSRPCLEQSNPEPNRQKSWPWTFLNALYFAQNGFGNVAFTARLSLGNP